MPIVYTRTFHHNDWVDKVDRVQAGGDNGFNGRFHALEDDLDSVSGTVKVVSDKFDSVNTQISGLQTAIGSLGQVVKAPVTLGLAPLMRPVNPDANFSWSQMYWQTKSGVQANGSYVKVPGTNGPPAGTAFGVLPLELPSGVKMTNLQVLGTSPTPNLLSTVLTQELRNAPYTVVPLLTLQGFSGGQIPGTPVFASDLNVYYLYVSVTGALTGTELLRGFQITYQP